MSVTSSPVHPAVNGRGRHARRGSAALGVTESKNDVTEFRRVLVLYTGGTIGMVRGDDGGEFSSYIPLPRLLLFTHNRDFYNRKASTEPYIFW